MSSVLSACVILTFATRAVAQPTCMSGSSCPQDDAPTSLIQVSKAVKPGTQRSDDSVLAVEGDARMTKKVDIDCKKVCVTSNSADCGPNNMCKGFAGEPMQTFHVAGVGTTTRFFISGPFDQVYKGLTEQSLPVKVEFKPQVGPELNWIWLCVSKTVASAGTQIAGKIRKMVETFVPAAGFVGLGKKGKIADLSKTLFDVGPVGEAIIDILNNPTDLNLDTVESSVLNKYKADIARAYGDKGIAIKLIANPSMHDDNCMQFTNVVRDNARKTAFVYYGEGANATQLYLEDVMDFATILLAAKDNKIQQPKDVKDKSGVQVGK